MSFLVSLSALSRGLFWLALLVISYAAWAPAPELVISTGWDKSNHLLAFFTLIALSEFGWPVSVSLTRKLLGLVGYGFLIEVVQSFIPNREVSLLDVVADCCGLGIYLCLRPWWLQLRLKLERLSIFRSETLPQ